jgi:hypothetical protein
METVAAPGNCIWMLWTEPAYLSASLPMKAPRSFHSSPGLPGVRISHVMTPSDTDQLSHPG